MLRTLPQPATLSISAESSRRVQVADLQQAHGRLITAIGPLELSPERVEETLNELLALGGRLGLIPDPGRLRWQYDPARFRGRVRTAAPCTRAELPARMAELAARPAGEHPLTAWLAGDYVLLDFCHGLGDGRLVSLLNLAIATGADNPLVHSWFTRVESRHPVHRAVLHTFARRPQRLALLVRDRRARRLERSSAGTDTAVADFPEYWAGANPAVCIATMTPAATARMRRDRDRLSDTDSDAVSVSLAAMMCARMHTELRRQGIDAGADTAMIFDCRRYLPKGGHVAGNFTIGLSLDLTDPTNAAEISRKIVRAAQSGRPMAALALQTLNHRPTAAADAPPPMSRTVPRLRFSDVGDVAMSGVAWQSAPEEAYYNSLSTPDDPDTIVFTVARRGECFDLSVSFHSNVYAQTVIDSALQALAQWPQDPRPTNAGQASQAQTRPGQASNALTDESLGGSQ